MQFLTLFFSFASIVAGRPNPDAGIDIDNPSSSDPTTPPNKISFPSRAADPYPGGIPRHPDECDGHNPSGACFSILKSGGYIWFDKDSQCSDAQQAGLHTALWDARTLATYSSNFPNTPAGSRGMANANHWMGPDYSNYAKRIAGNLKRVSEFKSSESDSTYITISCKDTKNWCGKKIEAKNVGGYAWTYSGWFGWYHYITLCPTFFTLDTLDTKFTQVQAELAQGKTTMASNMDWLRNTGQFFMHEMMHTRIANGGDDVEPHIGDEFYREERGGLDNRYAYGAKWVNKLAQYDPKRGGGARRASTNADSYAILANSAWWWDTTGYFPSEAMVARTDSSDIFFPTLSLANGTDLGIVKFDDLYDAAFEELRTSGALKETDIEDTEPIASFTLPNTSVATRPSTAAASPPASTLPPPSPPPLPENTCGSWYKVLFNHFEIYGKNFDGNKVRDDGSGLKDEIRGCGKLTKWEYKELADDPNGYQWYAEGNLPIGTKACTGRAVESVGGHADGCKGS